MCFVNSDSIDRSGSSFSLFSAQYERTSIDIISNDSNLGLRANGSIQKFDGFLNVYGEFREKESLVSEESSDGPENNEKLLPDLSMESELAKHMPESSQHFTY